MFLLLVSVLGIFGEGWLVFGIPGRLLGLGLIVLGFGESALWAYRALRRQERLLEEFTPPTRIPSLPGRSSSGMWPCVPMVGG
jgi:hypothetical protein